MFFSTRGYTYSYSKSLKRVNNWELKDKAQGRYSNYSNSSLTEVAQMETHM